MKMERNEYFYEPTKVTMACVMRPFFLFFFAGEFQTKKESFGNSHMVHWWWNLITHNKMGKQKKNLQP